VAPGKTLGGNVLLAVDFGKEKDMDLIRDYRELVKVRQVKAVSTRAEKEIEARLECLEKESIVQAKSLEATHFDEIIKWLEQVEAVEKVLGSLDEKGGE